MYLKIWLKEMIKVNKKETPVNCENSTCKYNKDKVCLKFTQEFMFNNRVRCEERKY